MRMASINFSPFFSHLCLFFSAIKQFLEALKVHCIDEEIKWVPIHAKWAQATLFRRGNSRIVQCLLATPQWVTEKRDKCEVVTTKIKFPIISAGEPGGKSCVLAGGFWKFLQILVGTYFSFELSSSRAIVLNVVKLSVNSPNVWDCE